MVWDICMKKMEEKIMHDILYGHGTTEPQGLIGKSVIAQAVEFERQSIKDGKVVSEPVQVIWPE